MTKTIINQPVNITHFGFKKGLRLYPRQMEYEGKTYSFVDAGLSCVVRHGERITQIMTLSDGHTQFRLRSDGRGGLWTLLSIGGV